MSEIVHSNPLGSKRARLRRFLLRHVPLAVGSGVLLLLLALTGLYFYASSQSFQNLVRERLVTSLSNLTGGRVEVGAFHWRLLHLQAEADHVVIHGREAASEAPYASIERLSAQISVLGLLRPHIELANLEIDRPMLHLIVYPDGATNQPQPQTRRVSKTPVLQRLFALKARHLAVRDGWLHYENRAARFDFQDRLEPLDFSAEDVLLQTSYVPPAGNAGESYRIDLGGANLVLARGAGKKREPAVRGTAQATLVLMRNAVRLEELRLSAPGPARGEVHTLTVTGTLLDFSHPHWQAKTQGDLDMRLIEPLTGYPNAPEGIARLDLTESGAGSTFEVDGRVHVDGGAYVGTGVVARGITLDARVAANPDRLLIDDVVARFSAGGAMEGTVDLRNWLPAPANQVEVMASPLAEQRSREPRAPGKRGPATVQALTTTIPVDGKVTAQLENLPLDVLLDMVSEKPYQRLGIDALLNGPAEAAWNHGDDNTVAVSTKLALTPSGRPPAGEVPTTGTVDATYTQKDGAVDLRQLALHLPGSSIEANGRLGAYPMTSPTALTVSFHSARLAEFDTVLRDMGLERGARRGAAALPTQLNGQAQFNGTWTGSLLRPRIAGSVHATQVAVEMPAAKNTGGQPRFLSFDAVDASGSYSDARIAIQQGVFQRGAARVTVSGTLDAAVQPKATSSPEERRPQTAARRSESLEETSYNEETAARLHVQAEDVSLDDLRPYFPGPLPAAGTLAAQFDVTGTLAAPGGSGWVVLSNGSIYSQPVARARAQGAFAGQTLKLSSLRIQIASGTVNGSGSYDFAARRFQATLKGSGLELAQIRWPQKAKFSVAGKLGISATGSGTLDDPQVQGNATVAGLVVDGETLGALHATAHTAGHALLYDATTFLAGAELNLHGQTQLLGDYATENRIEFSRFDVGALLKLAHVEGLSGQSALQGTVTLTGPLAHPDQLQGEAKLEQLAVTLAGVHLVGDGGLHATLSGGRIHLDPVHVTGEDTDIHAVGTIAFSRERPLDLAASGTINLKLAETLDPDLTASGTTTFEVEAHGTVQNPGLRGRIDIHNGSLSLEDIPNGLSQMQGTLMFNRNRLEVRNLTAMSGGGLLNVGGSLSYQRGVFADLTVTGKGVRIRYPEGISSLADADLRLQGPANNLLLSGNVLITRFATSPDLDLASLAAQASAKTQTVVMPNTPSSRLRLDIHLTSSPQLNFQNAFAKLAGNVDLRLRGTMASPSVLGRVSVTEGSAVIAGTRYELQRGDITFSNPVRIEPVIDMTATARVQDYDITLGLHGTLQKMSVTYRSDPPMSESDVVALLASGHTQDQERLYTQQQQQEFGNPATDALLGGALNATMSSRVQKLFGAGSVKVDPDYLGAFGNSTSRITVQEQVGRNVTLTYATDVNTTGQQLLQAEIAVNRHVSVVVARDEAGVFSMVIKATRRYR
ncbi:MAG: translocation/assembly module TamB domain-containing protein [Acidobacteriota bacterium]